MELKSQRHNVTDLGAAIEVCYTNGWTDGLPVIPPTAERVEGMLNAAGLKPDHELAFIENRQVSVTAEKVAINAVMAGCKSEYMPVVAAAIEAMGDPQYGYHGPATSTGGSAVFMVVNGPIAKKLEINSGDQPLRSGLARQRDDRTRRAAHDAQRHRHDAGRARPQQHGPRRQVHVMHRENETDSRGRRSTPRAASPRPECSHGLRALARTSIRTARRRGPKATRHGMRVHEVLGGLGTPAQYAMSSRASIS